ncbi:MULTISPECIES: tetratricopeptide repeat protein [unclassified Nocardia]|uniref:tetratricopeptide repeat protein n=1 Tax=unclassified Nocardia TaxID=2637762 RepID=UPI001CE45A2E|nr:MULTISPECIES: tetratricopeptide repeat protein [unclassified Nocardia]
MPLLLPDTVELFGRDEELRQILTAKPGQVVSIYNEHGGSGKTALATSAAHQLASRFPDGQFFVRLHSHTPGQPAAAALDVLASLLVRMGIAPRCLPDTEDGCRVRWRERSARKRILLILDDAEDLASIAPLLPGNETCLTLVTSRRPLFEPGDAVSLELKQLGRGSAVRLLNHFSHRRPANSRDTRAVDTIVRSCGFLPLAIKVSAGRVARGRSLSGQAGELTAAADRLAGVDISDRASYAVFKLSYDDLPAARRRLYRRLSLNRGADFDAYAAAALGELDLSTARGELVALCTEHLLEQTGEKRFRLHDQLLEYLRRDESFDDDSAVERLLDYYQYSAANADRLLARYVPPGDNSVFVPRTGIRIRTFENPKNALEWLRAERDNLLAWLEYTIDRDPARMIALTAALAMILYQDGPSSLAVQLHARAAVTAQRLDDTAAEADALVDLGAVHWLTGNYTRATEVLEQARGLYRERRDRHGEANALNNLGIVRRLTHDYGPAVELLEAARDQFHRVGDRLGEANALNDLGVVRWLTWDYIEADNMQVRALELYREVPYPRGVANALTDIGIVRWVAGDYSRVGDVLRQALTLFDELAFVRWEANAATDLGVVRRLDGDYDKVDGLLQEALDLNIRIDDRLGVASTLNNLGIVRWLIGDDEKAEGFHRDALARYRELGYRHGEADALNNLGVVCRLRGDFPGATEFHRQALTLYLELGDHCGEADVLKNLGAVICSTGDYGEATALNERALGLYRGLGERLGEAQAHNGIGTSLLSAGEIDRAASEFAEAARIAEAIGNRLELARALESAAQCHEDTTEAAPIAALRRAVDLYRRLRVREFPCAAEHLRARMTIRGRKLLADPDSAEGRYDLDEAIELFRYVLFTSDDAHPAITVALSNLARALTIRARCRGSLTDLDDAVSLLRRAAHMDPDEQAERLEDLAAALRLRFERTGLPADRQEADRLAVVQADPQHDDSTYSAANDFRRQDNSREGVEAHVEYRSDEPARRGAEFRVAVWLETTEQAVPDPAAIRLRVVLDAQASEVVPVTRLTRMGTDRRTTAVEFAVTPSFSGSLPLIFRFYRDHDNQPVLEVRSGVLVCDAEMVR